MAHDEWYTPLEIIEPIREFYGGIINVDLASCEKANKTIKAGRYFTIDDPLPVEGCFKFGATVCCNPPYCNNVVKSWINRIDDLFLNSDCQIIMLLNRSDAKWYYQFLDNHRRGYYQFRNRIKFIDGLTGKPSSPRYNNDLIYWGNDVTNFQLMCIHNFGKPVPASK